MDWGIVLAIGASLLAAWIFLVAVLWALRPRDVDLAQLIRVVPDILRLMRDLIADGRAPFGVRLASIGLLAWLVNPVDPIPEFVPVLGPLDDVVVAMLVLRYVDRRLGRDELRRRWRGSDDGFMLLGGILGRAS